MYKIDPFNLMVNHFRKPLEKREEGYEYVNRTDCGRGSFLLVGILMFAVIIKYLVSPSNATANYFSRAFKLRHRKCYATILFQTRFIRDCLESVPKL
jgi:hypothetical protein